MSGGRWVVDAAPSLTDKKLGRWWVVVVVTSSKVQSQPFEEEEENTFLSRIEGKVFHNDVRARNPFVFLSCRQLNDRCTTAGSANV